MPDAPGHPKSHSRKKRGELIQEFTDIFCEHNFADTDYTDIQEGPLAFDTMEEWVQQASVSSILKTFTYFIWTDKIIEGYFNERIENHLVDQLLLRLETVVVNRESLMVNGEW